MPFVKIRPDLIINTDYVVSVDVRDDAAYLRLTSEFGFDQGIVEVSLAAAAVLFDLMEISQAFDFSPDPKTYEQTLTSQLATILRDTQPAGARCSQLSALVDATEELTMEALLKLRRENVVVIALGTKLWYHVTNAPACDGEFCKLKLGHIGPHTTYKDKPETVWHYMPPNSDKTACGASDLHTSPRLALVNCSDCLQLTSSIQHLASTSTPSPDLSTADVAPVSNPAADSES